MNRLRQPGDSHYDVLGVSPGATEQEIENAFHRLIDRKGYKVDIPLNRQWLRARQIKDAHETLGDPVKRRAYDETLGRVPEPAPWAMTANDPGTDNLILPKEPDAPEPAESDAIPEAVVAGNAEMTSSDPEPLPGAVPEPDEQAGRGIDDGRSAPDIAPTFNDNETASDSLVGDGDRASVGKSGVVTAVASALGLILVAAWFGSNPRPSTSEEPPGVTAGAWQASGAGPGSARQAPGSFNGTARPAPETQGASTRQSPAVSDAAGRPMEPGPTNLERTTNDVGKLAASDMAAAQSPAGAAARADASPASPVAGESRAMAPASAPPVARATEIETAPQGAGSSASPIRTPAQWIGGGPTDADNRRGRYQGTVEVQVIVEPGGRVSNCAPVRGSGDAGLDALTCRLVRERARFTPALDAQGRPVASEAYTSFVWGRKPRD